MNISDTFLVNTQNFETIIEIPAKGHFKNPILNAKLLERLHFSDFNDLLIIRLLKDFNIINRDGQPDPA